MVSKSLDLPKVSHERDRDVTVGLDHVDPKSWRVEAIYYKPDGAIEVTLFSGPDSRKRSFEYAAWKYERDGGSIFKLELQGILENES